MIAITEGVIHTPWEAANKTGSGATMGESSIQNLCRSIIFAWAVYTSAVWSENVILHSLLVRHKTLRSHFPGMPAGGYVLRLKLRFYRVWQLDCHAVLAWSCSRASSELERCSCFLPSTCAQTGANMLRWKWWLLCCHFLQRSCSALCTRVL